MKLYKKLISICVVSCILIFLIPSLCVQEEYLGYYPDDNITVVGSSEWAEWHDIKFNQSKCNNKEVLNTFDCCGGHVTTYCKKVWSYAYYWCESHSMDNKCYWEFNIHN